MGFTHELIFHQNGAAGAHPGQFWGVDVPDGDAVPWVLAPVGTLYAYKPDETTAPTLYMKRAANDADADWLVLGGSSNSAVVWGQGTGAAPVVSSSANVNFLEHRFSSTTTTAASDVRGYYLRLYIDGSTTGGGEALRAFTTVNASIGTAHGAHISLNFGASGAVSGQAIAGRNTLHLPSGTATGTLAPLQGEIYLDAADSAPSAAHGLLRLVVDGDATNKATVDNLMLLNGVQVTAASSAVTHMVTTGCADATSNTRLKVNIDGTDYWLLATSSAPSA